MGTAIANTIHGSDFDDTLSGLGGNDTLLGHGGNDTMSGAGGADSMDGGGGLRHRDYSVTAADTHPVTLNGRDRGTGDGRRRIDDSSRNVENVRRDRTRWPTPARADNSCRDSGDNTLTGWPATTRSPAARQRHARRRRRRRQMTGGAGNDTYVVDKPATVVEERPAAAPTSTELASRYTLAAECREPDADRFGGIDGTGNALNNTITGNAATTCWTAAPAPSDARRRRQRHLRRRQRRRHGQSRRGRRHRHWCRARSATRWRPRSRT